MQQCHPIPIEEYHKVGILIMHFAEDLLLSSARSREERSPDCNTMHDSFEERKRI